MKILSELSLDHHSRDAGAMGRALRYAARFTGAFRSAEGLSPAERELVLRDIDWTSTPFNAGYTISVIGGWAPENPIERVSIQRFRMNGRAIQSIEELEIHTRHCKDLLLEP